MKIDYGDPASDVLSLVLNALQFKGQLFCYSKFTAPWAIRLKAKNHAHFHFVERGQVKIELEKSGAETFLTSGDLVILPHGSAHILRDNDKTQPVNVDRLFEKREDHILRHGGGGVETTAVCGGFTFENEIGNPIFSMLPELIHVPRDKMRAYAWLEPMLRLLAHEAQNPSEGSVSIIAHLTAIIFVQAVRSWIEMQPESQVGWLAALRDKQISAAMNLMHRNPNYQWTVAKLASEVGMSRSPFAGKFTSLVGEPPHAYLTKWRMNLAASYLRYDQMNIREIAEQVGYESQASFTNAFKRNFRISPKEYREKQLAGIG
jgi:AraC-like DNA-binding protein/quercetin dioxygenase-like cupin family protein